MDSSASARPGFLLFPAGLFSTTRGAWAVHSRLPKIWASSARRRSPLSCAPSLPRPKWC